MPGRDDRSGWLSTASLVPEALPAVRPEDWTGSWIREEAQVVIKAGTATGLLVHGEATFGALDPDRVERGAVNLGDVQADVAPSGATLAFDVGVDKTLPVDKGDDQDCKVRMRRLGPFFLIADNQNCGGMNVSFSGSYRCAP